MEDFRDDQKNFFRSGVCHYCKKICLPITRCKSCKILAYCCKDHQVKDWKSHKRLCQVIANEGTFLKYKVDSYNDLINYKKRRGCYWQYKLGRQLKQYESQMWLFPIYCAVCFCKEDVFPCTDCLTEYYCSKGHQDKHKTHHKIFCKDFRLSLDLDCFFYNNTPLFVLKSKEISDEINCIPEDINFLTSLYDSSVSNRDLHFINSCDEILSGLTILFGLEHGKVIINRKISDKSLVIHLIGTSIFELSLNWIFITETFIHYIQNLEKIIFIFVGPECFQNDFFKNVKNELCNNCKNKNLDINAEYYKCLYHEKISELKKPDIVIAFNSGLHEFVDSKNDSWKDSLSSLMYYSDVPLILTAYTEIEINADVNLIRNIANIGIIYGPKHNPYSNLKPLLDWENNLHPVYYINNYVAVLKKVI